MTQGWGTWEEDRRYPSEDGEHMITVYKRTQRYGDAEPQVRWKNERRKITPQERTDLQRSCVDLASKAEDGRSV